uniref:Retrovirus-related Pol polyprotein from transposon TNT 1-94-like beta-barrel domain-containing protein n=1 Tax=Lactuca sativa TaxID=4236 RepID=A0A9R1UMS7_LACSA|nr:hypothetical protein LSAT_V11C800426430 [Lactuca sativa]
MASGDSVKDLTNKFDKLNKFEGQDFRRWKNKMHFLLTTLKMVYVLSITMLDFVDDENLEATRRRSKWDNDDCIFRGYILNAFNVQDDDVAWWVDLGATSHICEDLRWFQECKPIKDGFMVKMGNIATEPIMGLESILLYFTFGKCLCPNNVLYVPGIQKNLVSEIMLSNYGYKQQSSNKSTTQGEDVSARTNSMPEHRMSTRARKAKCFVSDFQLYSIEATWD